MAAGEQSGAAGAHGVSTIKVTVKMRVRVLILKHPQDDIIRESSSPEPVVRPLGRGLPRSPRLPRRWSWRFRMPSQHPMTLRSHTRGIAAAEPSRSLLAGVQPPRRRITVQTPRGKFMNNHILFSLSACLLVEAKRLPSLLYFHPHIRRLPKGPGCFTDASEFLKK